MILRLTVVAAAVLWAAGLPAESQPQGHVEAVTDGEDRGETRLGETAYETRFEGLWAEDGRCGEHDRTWAFATDTVRHGSLTCTGLGKMHWEDGSLVIPLGTCRDRGRDVEPARLTLSETDGPGIVAVYGGARSELLPCTGN